MEPGGRTAPPWAALCRSHKPGAPCHPLSLPEVLAVSLINEALDQGSPEKTLSALLLPAARLDDISLPVAPRYHHLLVAARRQKAQVRFGLAASVTGARTPLWVELCPLHPSRALTSWTPSLWGGGRWGSDVASGPVTGQSCTSQHRGWGLVCGKTGLGATAEG